MARSPFTTSERMQVGSEKPTFGRCCCCNCAQPCEGETMAHFTERWIDCTRNAEWPAEWRLYMLTCVMRADKPINQGLAEDMPQTAK